MNSRDKNSQNRDNAIELPPALPAVPEPLHEHYQKNYPVIKTSTQAILSLVFSLAPVVLVWIPILSFLALLCPIAGIIMGFIAKKKIAQNPYELSGNGLALGGIITGFVLLGLTILVAITLFIISAIVGAVTRAIGGVITETLIDIISRLLSGK